MAEEQGQPSPWQQLKHPLFLGADAFVDSLRRKIPEDRDLREVPQAKVRPAAKSLDDYIRDAGDHDGAIAAAYAGGGYTLKAIGDYFGLHYSRVSKIVRLGKQVEKKAKGKT